MRLAERFDNVVNLTEVLCESLIVCFGVQRHGDGLRWFGNVQAMATTLAGASVERGVEVVATWKHVNKEASGGCHARLIGLLVFEIVGLTVNQYQAWLLPLQTPHRRSKMLQNVH